LNSEIVVEGQLVENVLKQLESEFSKRIISASTANRASVGVLNQTTIEEERESIKKNSRKQCWFPTRCKGYTLSSDR